MKRLFSSLFSDKVQLVSFLVNTFLLFIYPLLALITYQKLPPVLPLFNQMPWGDDRIGGRLGIFLPFGLALFVWIGNNVFSVLFFKEVPLIARVLALTSLLITILAILFLVLTLLLVLS